MGDYVRWAPPYYEGAEDSAKGALFLALNRGKRSIRINLKEEARPRGAAAARARVRRAARVLPPGRARPARRRLRAPARGEPGPRLLRDHRLRPGRPLRGPLRPRHELPRPDRAARPDRRARRPADPGRRPDRRHRRRRADGGLRDPGRAARARPLGRGPARGRVDVRRRAVAGWRWWPARYFADGEVPRRGELELAGKFVCYRPYACKDGYVTLGALEPKFWQAWCHGVGPRGPGREAVRRAGLGRPTPRSSASSSSARARSGASSPRSTTAASSRCSTSTRCSTPSSCARARWWSSSTSPGRPSPCASSACRSSSRARPARRRARARRWASTPTRCSPSLGYSEEEIAALKESGAVDGPGGRARRARSWGRERTDERPAQDEGARRGERRQRGHDQALPARGPAARAGQDLAQHGLLPARVRRADQADQAAPGGALHAAQAHQGGARRGPRARPGAGRARGP